MIAKFNFEDLCGQPLSAADYIEITKNFGTVFVLNIPKMGMDKKDLVRFYPAFSMTRCDLTTTTCRQEDLLLSLMVRTSQNSIPNLTRRPSCSLL